MASDASEFEVGGLPVGPHRVRALDLFGRVTFASGFYARADSNAMPAVRLWNRIDLDEPEGREVVGFVRWESGIPAAKAPVVMQNSLNFRKFVRRVETDDHGFFRFENVTGDEPYFIFALPPGEEDAMRNFDYFPVASGQREVWHDQILHPHRVRGSVTRADQTLKLQLVRIDGKAERLVSSFQADATGQFALANVPHGRYFVQKSSGKAHANRSLPIEVAEGKEEVAVRWAESSF